MMSHSNDHGQHGEVPIMLVPRINVQAFVDTAPTADTLRTAFADRRMARAHGAVMNGGIAAAIRLYQTQSSPNLLIVESQSDRDVLLVSLASLAEVCQPDTKVVVIGHMNDVILYRELIRQGVSEYIVAPVQPLQMVELIASLYRSEKSLPLGRVISFIGAKGGAGSSTIAHNCAWELARITDAETAIIDLDLAFGTAALNFNLDSSGGIMEAISQPERVDALLLDRLLMKLGEKLSLLGGPGGVERDFIIEPHAVEIITAAMRSTVPLIVADLPSIWAPWVKFALLHSDSIVITVEPELASLRNARALFDMLRLERPNDLPPILVVNQVGVPKRPEIPVADFIKAIGSSGAAVIPFDPQSVGAAGNGGRMVVDMAPRAKSSEAIRKLARSLAGGVPAKSAPTAQTVLKKLFALGKK